MTEKKTNFRTNGNLLKNKCTGPIAVLGSRRERFKDPFSYHCPAAGAEAAAALAAFSRLRASMSSFSFSIARRCWRT